jgi:outer membrane biosynthesis protein TonB
MPDMISRFRFSLFAASPARLGVLVLGAGMAVVLAPSTLTGLKAQQSAPAPAADNQPAQQPSGGQSAPPAPAPAPEAQPAAQQPSNDQAPQVTPAPPAAPAETQPAPAPSVSQSAPSHASEPPEITEDEIRRLLTGKQLFLRGGYLDNALSYNEHGALIGHSPQGSYTLCGMEIDKIHLTKHKVELEGQRYGLHFLGALPYEDPTKAVDRVNITPKKKVVKITIDRELVVKPKEKKEKGKAPASMHTAGPAQAAAPATGPAAAPAATPEGDKAQAGVAAGPEEDRAANEKSATTTTSQAHANKVLRDALDNVFAQGFDSRMMASMPEFWKLYYEAAAAKTDYQPSDENVLRENMVDKKAQLKTNFEPASNEYAQNHGVAGISLYHVVVGADGKAGEIAVARPIGFGLDENAVDSIRKAMFEPAIKDGKPVPVMLNLVVEFRIYSKRTAVTGNPGNAPAGPSLPGPYSAAHQ